MEVKKIKKLCNYYFIDLYILFYFLKTGAKKEILIVIWWILVLFPFFERIKKWITFQFFLSYIYFPSLFFRTKQSTLSISLHFFFNPLPSFIFSTLPNIAWGRIIQGKTLTSYTISKVTKLSSIFIKILET